MSGLSKVDLSFPRSFFIDIYLVESLRGKELALENEGVFIGSYANYRNIGIAVYYNGTLIGKRLKHRLTKTEIETGRKPGKIKHPGQWCF